MVCSDADLGAVATGGCHGVFEFEWFVSLGRPNPLQSGLGRAGGRALESGQPGMRQLG